MKKYKAQHIIEFVILFPFLIALFVLCMQLGNALALNFKFVNVLNQTINKVAFTSPTKAEIEQLVREKLSLSKFPDADNVSVEIVKVNEMDVIIGKYQYKTPLYSAKAIFESTPQDFISSAIIPVNEAILRDNTYNMTQDELDVFIQNLNELNTQIYNELNPE
jgi:hypothetical protein